MKKILIIIMLLALFSPSVSALQDVFITMQGTSGLCIRDPSSECQICKNETMTLEGTEDHVLILENTALYDVCEVDNDSDNMFEFLGFVFSIGFIRKIMFTLAGIFIAVFLMRRFKKG